MSRTIAATVAALALIVSLTGCTVAPASREATAGASPTATAVANQTSEQNATIKAFVTAAFGDSYEVATQHASPGSAAERYVVHQQAVNAAFNANGDGQNDPANDPTLTFEDGVVTVVQAEIGTYTLSDFTFDDDGLVSGWTGKSGTVESTLWTQPWAGDIGGNTLELVSAYKANSGSLFVVLKATASTQSISPYGYSATYSASDGITYSVVGSSQPQSIAAGSAGYVVLIFDGAPFGGTVNLSGASPEDFSAIWAASIPVS
ncbi:hypothetical protein KXS11_17605 [Plantibacter flavus]|uniref:hypothetical protein n=1 Tax=Plantibacter flavus TaxID=150123 RepID=UPI003F154036